MRICVTGGSGFIGQHTVKKLVEAKHQVMGIDRNLPHSDVGFLSRNTPKLIDIMDATSMERAFERFGPDAVLHLAANSSLQRSITEPLFDVKNNVIGTLVVVGLAQRYKCRLIFASTSAVYGPKESGKYRETDLVKPQVAYGVSKAAGEMYVRSSGLSYAILRYGNVYGPGQKPLGENILIARTLAHMKDGEPFRINGDGEQVRDWIYIEDVVDANVAALLSSASGTFNIATGIGISVNEVVERLRAIVGFHEDIEHNPPNEGELRSVILDSKLARKTLDWRAVVPLELGLRETAEAWT